MTLSSNLNFIGVAVIGRVFASSGKPWAPAKRSWISRAAILCAMLSWPSANCFAQYTWTAASNRTWDVTSANWTTGAGNIAWVDNNAAVLTSSGTGSITVAGTRTVTDFTAAGTYTLTGGTITMSGSTSALAIQSDTTTISSVLAGTVGLRKSGVGTLVLTSANTYNGTTTVNAGTLQVGDGGTSGSLGTGAIVNNGNLVYNRSTGSVALPNAGITGSGSLSLTSAGRVDLQNGLVIDLTGRQTWTASATSGRYNGFTLADSGTVTLRSQTGISMSGMLGTAFSDTGVLNIDTSAGNANVDLNVAIGVNAVNYSLAQLNVTSGTGVITISNTTGASWGVTSNAYIRQLTLSGRDVNVSANIPYFGRITVTNSGSNSTFSGTIGTTGSTGTVFTKAGDGLLIITANNTYAGDTAINAGTLQVGNGGTAGSLGSGAIANSGALVFSRSDSVTVASGISGTGSLTQSGSGSLILTGANTYSGTTTVSSGALQVGSGGTTGSLGTAAVVNNASLVFNRSNSVSVGNPISGAGSLTQSGSGSLILTGTNTYSGTTTVSSGTLQVGNGGTIGSIGTGAITNNGALVFNRSDSVTVASAISGAGSLEQRGAGSLILTGANTYSGTTTVSSGTLQVGNGGTTGSLGTNAIVNNGNLVFNRSTGSVAFPTAGIIGSGSLSLTSAGRVDLQNRLVIDLTGRQTWTASATSGRYNGFTLADSGTVTLRSQTGISMSGMLGTAFSDTGVLNIDTSAGNANVDLNVAIGVNAVNYSLAQLNVTSGTGVITLSNTTGLSWGTGGAYIRQLSLNGRDVNVSAAIPYFGTITVTTSGSNSTFSGNIGTTGSAGTVFTKVGAGALSLTGTNTFTGAMAITGGILQFGRPASLYSGSTANWNAANISTGSGATLAFNVGGGSEFTTGNVTTLLTNLASSTSTANGMNAGSALGFDTSNASGGTFTINDAIADTTGANGGARGLVKLGAGTLVLGGSNGFTGATTISAGVLSFANKNALAATSGISIANGAGLTYTGAADTFARNITVSSGIGAVTNAGVGSLALSGTLTKNGTVLRLRGGSAGITVTGIITGTSLNSDLAVQNGFTTLSTANSYTGPTFINSSGTLALATNNAIPSNSAVTIGGSDAGGDGGPGRLTMGTYTNQIGSLSFSGSGGTIAMAPTSSATSTVVLSATGAVNLAGTSTLDLTSMATGAGLYRLVAGSSVSGTFGSVTGLNSNYLLRYNTVNANEVDAQRKAEFGTITATPAATSIITGGSTAFGYTVSNITPTGGSTLSFASSNGSNVVGSSGGTAGANSTSTNIAGLFFTGTTVGASQTGSFTLTDANAIGSPANGSVTVDVLDHATPGFLASGITNAYTQDVLNIDFGSIDQAAGIQNFTYNLLNLASQTYGAGLTAGLDFTAFTADGDGFTSGLTTFNNLGGGGTSSLFTFTFNPTGQGTFSKTFTLSFYDNQNLSGASSRRDLTINAQVIVVPEPGSLALAGLGVGLVGWSLWARRRIT